MSLRKTKTFVQNTWYRRKPGGDAHEWNKIAEDVPIDQQVNDWVASTQHIIVHPGQLGMHVHHDQDQTLRGVTLGLTVLYEECNANTQSTPARAAPTAASVAFNS